MTPILALILCTLFVLFLLRLDHKQFPDASYALWIPALWMLLNSSKALGIWFGTGGVSMEEGSQLDRVVLNTLLCMSVMIVIKRGFKRPNVIKDNIWVIVYLAFLFMSILWSDMMFVSFKRCVRQLIPIVMAFAVSTENDPIQAAKSIFRRVIYVHIPFSYILIHYFPEYGREYGRWSGALTWIGVASQKNGLAALCLFAMIFLIWTLIRRLQGRDKPVAWYQTYIEISILMMAFWLFLGPNHTLTYSVTSLVALVVGLLVLMGLYLLKRQNIVIGAKTLSFMMAIVIVYGTITPFTGGMLESDFASTLNRDETLTGRTEIWAYLTPHVMQKPLLGHGFGGFWTEEIRAKTSSHAHNGYLDIILNLGFVGIIIFFMLYLSYCRQAGQCLRYEYDLGCLWISLLFVATVHNIAESSVTAFTGLFSSSLLFLFISHNARGKIEEFTVKPHEVEPLS
jgi:O-antigen ligase